MAKKAKRTGTGAALYCRVSTDHQVEDGVSLEAQRARLEAYAVAAGLEVKAVLIEAGVSGSVPLADRPEGKNLVAMIEAGEVAHVVFLKLDRAFRSAADALATVEAWDAAGVGVHFVDHGGQSMNTASAVGRMIFTMLAAMAEFERSLAAERTTAALAHKKATGKVYAPTPFGKDRVEDDLIENTEEQAVITRIKELRAEGLSLRKIADRLNEEGVPTKQGKSWYASTLKYILENAA